MGKVIRWLKDRLPTQRRLIQLYAALLHNAHVKGFITGELYTGGAKFLCTPGLNCYSCPAATGACPLGALQNALAGSGKGAPAYILGCLLLMGLTLGRTICGFLCPAGLLQELLHRIPTPKLRKSRVTRALSWLKYVILAVFVVALPLWYGLRRLNVPAFCKYLCPAGTAEGALPLLANPANEGMWAGLDLLFTRKVLILVAVVAACVFVYRAFCRFLCPLGALYGLFSRLAVIGVRVEASRCTDCGRCVSHCRMDVTRVGDRECIHCGECIGECPAKAITLRAGRYVLQGHHKDADPAAHRRKRTRCRMAWGIALMVLAAVMLAVNWPDPVPAEAPALPAAPPEVVLPEKSALPEEPAAPQLPVGREVGMLAPDFTVPLYGGGTFTLSQHRGKTVFVNFWATWCGPCVQELPHFERIRQAHPEQVEVICIHANLATDDVEAFLREFGFDLPFALDADGSVLKSFGGSLALPHTIVIDPTGVITYNAVGSVDAARLERLLLEAQP